MSTYIGGTTATSATSINMPSGAQLGDLLLLVLYGGGSVPTFPSAFTPISSDTSTNSGIGYAWVPAVPPSSYAFGVFTYSGVLLAYRGIQTASPVENNNKTSGSGTTWSVGSITPVATGDTSVVFLVVGGSIVPSVATGYAGRLSTSDAFFGAYPQDKLSLTAGVPDNPSGTLTGGGFFSSFVSYHVVLASIISSTSIGLRRRMMV